MNSLEATPFSLSPGTATVVTLAPWTCRKAIGLPGPRGKLVGRGVGLLVRENGSEFLEELALYLRFRLFQCGFEPTHPPSGRHWN